MNLKIGDILFYKTHSISGAVIRALQRKLYGNHWYADANHVAICVETPDTLREAVIPRSKLRLTSDVENRELILIIRPRYCKNRQSRIWAEKQKKYVGKYYGLPEILGLLIVALGHLVGIKFKKNPLRQGQICTEDSYQAVRDLEKEHGVEYILEHHIHSNSRYITELLLLLAHHVDYEVLPMKDVMDYLSLIRKN
jgi:hypothetical protein